ncbi:hypothetical protein PRIPAC_89284 [Pristionchus pacificus]|uniref:Uncharacterized protein n=1 Tax=Pristionchus pacificus TaxID=54126 RepID=A0A2A6B9I8_PRIPA|nr:hypothetical protein PRIPAC_89284 [Pristionchus pacificus]|eukprot:PDM62545.1 hypothetical protein PRIPAC_51987 [Pristionchus pacificus]
MISFSKWITVSAAMIKSKGLAYCCLQHEFLHGKVLAEVLVEVGHDHGTYDLTEQIQSFGRLASQNGDRIAD